MQHPCAQNKTKEMHLCYQLTAVHAALKHTDTFTGGEDPGPHSETAYTHKSVLRLRYECFSHK